MDTRQKKGITDVLISLSLLSSSTSSLALFSFVVFVFDQHSRNTRRKSKSQEWEQKTTLLQEQRKGYQQKAAKQQEPQKQEAQARARKELVITRVCLRHQRFCSHASEGKKAKAQFWKPGFGCCLNYLMKYGNILFYYGYSKNNEITLILPINLIFRMHRRNGAASPRHKANPPIYSLGKNTARGRGRERD